MIVTDVRDTDPASATYGQVVGYRVEDLASGMPDQVFTLEEWAEVAATPSTEHAVTALEIVARKATENVPAEPAFVEPVTDAQPAEAPPASQEA